MTRLKRAHSEQRQMQAMLSVRLSDDQLVELKRRARRAGVSLGMYVRTELFQKTQ